ncbi:hypothetical protein AH02_35 [Pseudomonas phage AH02]|nr:hypothetical protein AH02_35 [Pseudomonas phage AH02]
MKLVDILARQLEEWPNGCERIFQDYDKELRYEGICYSRSGLYPYELCAGYRRKCSYSDHDIEIVTRDQWQAAVNALKAAESALPEWSVEGLLPPVGAVCEVSPCGSSRFCKATVLFCQDNALVISWEGEGVAHAARLSDVQIRPIRTPEQIAAEDREKGIREMIKFIQKAHNCSDYASAEVLYDAGYRKQESGK